ncbi:MAG: NAD(P)-dependent oxidoreductase [Candidatus Pacearchaeota archaeon]
MKLAFFEVEEWQKKYLKERLKGHNIKFFEYDLNARNASKVKDIEGLGIFIYSQIDEKILDKLPKLKFIATMSTGFDHINVNACKLKGIKVSNVPYYGENTVAEHTIGLMLCLSKKLPLAIWRARKGNFNIDNLEGFDLKNKILGVIGAGHIGQKVIKIAKAMGMKIIVYTKTHDPKLSRELGFNYVSLDNLLRNSDIISFHVPLTAETKHMINMKNVKMVKRGAYLINTARGGLIDTKALLYGLDHGIFAGAALDVLEEEETLKEERHLSKKHYTKEEIKILRENHQLLKERNVLITPHTAFFTREAQQRILDTTIENIKSMGTKNQVQ